MSGANVSIPHNWDLVEVIEALYKGVCRAYLRGVHGDIAEFGTFGGRSAQVLATAMRMTEKRQAKQLELVGLSKGKQLHLFDSFQGLPETTEAPDNTSPLYESGLWREGAFNSTGRGSPHRGVIFEKDDFQPVTPEALHAMCAREFPAESIKVHAGWFKDTVPKLPADQKYALVHIDCDLYSSTLDCVGGLIAGNHLSPGALLYWDDWNCNVASPDFGERKAWDELVAKHNIRFSHEITYGYFGHSMIYHGHGG